MKTNNRLNSRFFCLARDARRSKPLFAMSSLYALLLAGCSSGSHSVPVNATTGTTGGTTTGSQTLTRQEFTYVVNADDNTVAQYKINTDGTLAPLTPPAVAVTANAVQALVTPNGQFAYVLAETPGTGAAVVSQFKTNSDGTLTPLTPATASLGSLIVTSSIFTTNGAGAFQRPTFVTMDAQGRSLYAPTASQILRFPIGANGTLGAPVPVAQSASPVLAFVMDPQGRFAYVGSQTQTQGVFLTPFKINPDGSFAQITGQDVPLTGVASLAGLALDSGGRFLYAASVLTEGADRVSKESLMQFQVNTDGTLALGKSTTIAPPTNLTGAGFDASQVNLLLAVAAFQPAFSADGHFVYLPTGTPRLLADSVGADGTLTPLTPGFALAGAVTGTVNIEPSGAFLYVANQDTTISQFRVNADGTLTPLVMPTVTTGHRPVSIATTAPTPAKSAARTVHAPIRK